MDTEIPEDGRNLVSHSYMLSNDDHQVSGNMASPVCMKGPMLVSGNYCWPEGEETSKLLASSSLWKRKQVKFTVASSEMHWPGILEYIVSKAYSHTDCSGGTSRVPALHGNCAKLYPLSCPISRYSRHLAVHMQRCLRISTRTRQAPREGVHCKNYNMSL